MVKVSTSLTRRTALSRFASIGFGSIVAGAGIATATKAARAGDYEFPRVVLEWLGAWGSDDAPREISSLYAPGGTYADIPAGSTVQGPDMESFLQTMFAAAGHFQRDLRVTLANENYFVADQLFTAFDPNGYDFMFQVYAITLFELDGNKILYSADYYDSGSILMQLGAIPAAPWFTAPNTPGAVGRFCEKSG